MGQFQTNQTRAMALIWVWIIFGLLLVMLVVVVSSAETDYSSSSWQSNTGPLLISNMTIFNNSLIAHLDPRIKNQARGPFKENVPLKNMKKKKKKRTTTTNNSYSSHRTNSSNEKSVIFYTKKPGPIATPTTIAKPSKLHWAAEQLLRSAQNNLARLVGRPIIVRLRKKGKQKGKGKAKHHKGKRHKEGGHGGGHRRRGGPHDAGEKMSNSKGYIIIGVVCGLLILGLLVACFYCMSRRGRKRAKRRNPRAIPSKNNSTEKVKSYYKSKRYYRKY